MPTPPGPRVRFGAFSTAIAESVMNGPPPPSLPWHPMQFDTGGVQMLAALDGAVRRAPGAGGATATRSSTARLDPTTVMRAPTATTAISDDQQKPDPP